MARSYGSVFERWLAKVSVSTDLAWNGTPCWIWQYGLNPAGYGIVSVKNPKGTWTGRLAHRVSFRLFRHREPGPMLDHLCRRRNCVNPDHLEEVTALQNFERGLAPEVLKLGLGPQVLAARTHCPIGHAYDEGNTYHTAKGHRKCRTCRREGMRRCRSQQAKI